MVNLAQFHFSASTDKRRSSTNSSSLVGIRDSARKPEFSHLTRRSREYFDNFGKSASVATLNTCPKCGMLEIRRYSSIKYNKLLAIMNLTNACPGL